MIYRHVESMEYQARSASFILLRTGWRASETFMYARAMGWNNAPFMTVAGTNGAAIQKIR